MAFEYFIFASKMNSYTGKDMSKTSRSTEKKTITEITCPDDSDRIITTN